MTPPRSRREQQQLTRDALIRAGRVVFARDGYHQANLTLIATEAGYSKGAVYSNFDSKADLFLAMLEENIDVSLGDGAWDPFGSQAPDGCSADLPDEQEEVAGLIRGLSLATLEFIATAARDESLVAQLATRLDVLVEGYAAIVDPSQSEHQGLLPEEVGALLAALDQGAALLTLSGSRVIDQRILREGMRRLLTPTEEREPAGQKGEPVLHDEVTRRRIAAAISLGRGVEAAE
ncbi:TetR/AcrR family transcriptional regulator [Ruania zhangjianzhongii]|uniref:TetR/AcrR family transcriptional regulator n=1 Tax=Ruania zhangjianzhongii TaxID=2603206 RepID=UPI00143CE4DB|nr:helix-turn-helix domain-containing protein [Ruania zhangjianzhongii]